MGLVEDGAGYRRTIGLGHTDAEPNHESKDSDLEHRLPPPNSNSGKPRRREPQPCAASQPQRRTENRVQPIRASEPKENLKKRRPSLNIHQLFTGSTHSAPDRSLTVWALTGASRLCNGFFRLS